MSYSQALLAPTHTAHWPIPHPHHTFCHPKNTFRRERLWRSVCVWCGFLDWHTLIQPRVYLQCCFLCFILFLGLNLSFCWLQATAVWQWNTWIISTSPQHNFWNKPKKTKCLIPHLWPTVNSPYPVWDTNSAAPPMGFVKTPTMPFPTPEMTPLALLPAELCISHCLWKFCMGWSTMPAIAPAQHSKTSLFLIDVLC